MTRPEFMAPANPHTHTLQASAVRTRLTSWPAVAGRALFAPGMWPARRIVGESLLSLTLVLLAVGGGLMEDEGTVRAVCVGLGAGLLSPLRRVLPASVLLATALGYAPFTGFTPLILVVSWSAGRRIDGLGRAAGVFTLAYGLAFGLTAVSQWSQVSLPILVFIGLFILVSIVVPGLAGRYWSQRRTLADTIREYNAQLLREHAMIAGQARMLERQRIAQDMHDSLGHQLALIAVHTGALEVDRELTGQQREAVGVLREASVAAMHELRDVVGVLRDDTAGTPQPADAGGGEDPGMPSRGVAGIDGLAEASRKAGTAVEVRRSGGVRPLAPTADHAAYRVVQEGLTNAHKHAPGASIAIGLRYEPDSLVVEVANGPAVNPVNSSVASGRQGLTGLEERARLVGGMVHAGPTADGGFRLAGVLPYTSQGDFPSSPPGEARTTFVAPPDDFRAQNPAGPSGESDPVTDRNILPKELAKAMSRTKRGNGIAIGCGVAGLIGVLVVIALVVGGIFLVRETDSAMIEPEQYKAVTVGQSEAEVREQLPDGDSVLNRSSGDYAPPVPEGSKCLTLLSTELGSSWDADPVFRFCFKDGKLIEKKSFDTTS